MNQLTVLIPFALPPAELARDLLRQASAPALAMLLARAGQTAPPQACDPFSRALPHEHWLAQHFGLTRSTPDSSPPAASALMQRFGHGAREGHWFVLHPAHIHVARDHLVLTDVGQLQLEQAQSQKLFDAAAPLFVELGYELIYGDARTWFIRADAWAGLRTSTPGAASGRNVDIWMPEGPGELAWRKLQNEVQMQWFTEALNEEREARGLKTVNSIWLWGGSNAGADTGAKPGATSVAPGGWQLPLGQGGAAELGALVAASGPRLLALDTLIELALAEEWGLWLQRVEELDRDWLAPLLDALRAGAIDRIELVLTGSDRVRQFGTGRANLRKFWVKPSLSRLAA
ncbi:hypothetical protein [Herbaspirillum sp. alder98]|uniref:hypothetical protein n=1 Tax=Herbaspirillum sp. alder98 TaxID=2913096 RepID=UPI001CD88934|nr:hypothetical protein [Herbaspirillum sp. alder98]MCA1326658.1 hypothetical protein [Herbaspirillum sp. alder98]